MGDEFSESSTVFYGIIKSLVIIFNFISRKSLINCSLNK